MIKNQISQSFLINWDKGSVSRSKCGPKTSSYNKTVTICGDWAPLGNHEAALRSDHCKFYNDIAQYLTDSDLLIVNVECPVRSNGEPLTKDGPNILMEPDIYTSLATISCKVACLANNHTMDFGKQGLVSSINTLQELGINVVGAGMNIEDAERPLIIEVGGLTLAIINIAEGEEAKATATKPGTAHLDVTNVLKNVSQLEKVSDVVLVIIHAGREYVPVPPPYIQSIYRSIADAGASLIVGHHPHVPQGVEIWNNVPIFYSQGNFVFRNKAKEAHYRNIGYLVNVSLSEVGIHSIDIVPYKISLDGLKLLTKNAKKEFLDELESISSILEASVTEMWDAYADMWFTSKLSSELKDFMQLMSWQAICDGVSYRLQTDAQQKGFIRKLLLKLFARSFRTTVKPSSDPNILAIKPAAIFHNRFDTFAHSELYKTVLYRVIEGKIGESASWANELLETWRSLD